MFGWRSLNRKRITEGAKGSAGCSPILDQLRSPLRSADCGGHLDGPSNCVPVCLNYYFPITPFGSAPLLIES